MQLHFRVVPDTVQTFDIILGRPFTESQELSYTRVGNELKFKNDDPIKGDDLTEQKGKLVAMEEKELGPGRVDFINIKTDIGNKCIMVDNQGKENKKIKIGQELGEKIFSVEEAPVRQPRTKPIELTEITIDKNITETQKLELLTLLNKYRECSATCLIELGCTNKIKMEIKIKEGAHLPQAKPYRLNTEDRGDLDKLVREYKGAGIVSETDAEVCSPAFVVRKPDGTPRMIVDYRGVNKVTIVVNYPIPNFDDLLELLNGAIFFIILDLASGYLQMPLTEEAKNLTSFITENETGRFERATVAVLSG